MLKKKEKKEFDADQGLEEVVNGGKRIKKDRKEEKEEKEGKVLGTN